MRRNSTLLKLKKCKVKDVNKHTWCNYENFSNMYCAVYDAMVESGVAIKLDEGDVQQHGGDYDGKI
jgi:hypothetical protein